MSKIKIITDSSADLPSSLIQSEKIEVVPLTVRINKKEFVDQQDLSPQQFWTLSKSSPTLPETAAPSPGKFLQAYEKAEKDGYRGVICITISSKLSSTFSSAVTGSQNFDGSIPITVIDSKNVSIGHGLSVLAASKLSHSEEKIEAIEEKIKNLIPKTKFFIALDTLENLKKGGRIGNAAAFFGSLLSIKPIISIKDGIVTAESRQRTRSRSLEYLIKKIKEESPIEDLSIASAQALDIDNFKNQISNFYDLSNSIISEVGPVIGAHAGPGAIGVAFHSLK